MIYIWIEVANLTAWLKLKPFNTYTAFCMVTLDYAMQRKETLCALNGTKGWHAWLGLAALIVQFPPWLYE